MALEITHRVTPQQRKDVRADLSRLADAGSLMLGDTGRAVESLQRMLRGLDLYAGPVNGTFDAATEAAVKKLGGDGVFDRAELKEVRSRQLFVKDDFRTPARPGQKGSDIRELEGQLRNLGYDVGRVDGVYDRQLEKAVRAFRRDDKNVPDRFQNVIGHRVLSGARGEVRELERNLRELGRDVGRVDGFYSDKTERAVRAFQRKHDLKPTGIANERTRNAIAREADRGVSDRTQRFIELAKSKVGANYVFGAEGPNAFDCSGLIHWALNQAGVNAPRLTAEGYRRHYADSRVSRENLKPGDLVFFHYPNSRGIPPGQASHIEIYLGNGMTMGTDNTAEDARIERMDWSAFIGGARVPGLNR